MTYDFSGLDTLLTPPPEEPEKDVAAATPRLPFASQTPRYDFSDLPKILGVDPADEQFAVAAFEASLRNPDQEAELTKLGRRLEEYLGPDAVPRARLTPIDAEQELRRLEADHATRASPKTRAWLSAEENARLALDDAKTLARIETAFDYLKDAGRALRASTYTLSAGVAGVAAMPFDAFSQILRTLGVPEDLAHSEVGALLREHFAEPALSVAESVGIQGDPEEKYGFVAGSALHGVQSLGMNLYALLPEVASRAVGGPTGIALGILTAASGGLSYLHAHKETEGDALRSMALAVPDMVAEFITERAQLKALFDTKAWRESFTKALARFLTLEVGGEVVADVWQNFNEWMVLNPSKSAEEWALEQPESAARAAIAAIVGGAGQTVVARSADAVFRLGVEQEVTQARANAFREAIKAVESSLLLKRDTTSLRNFLQSVAPESSVFVARDVLLDAISKAGVDQSKLPSLAEQQGADPLGLGVEVPVQELVLALAGTKAEELVIPHVRFDADAPTLAEVQKDAEKANEFFQREVEAAIESAVDREAFAADAKSVREQMLHDLSAVSPFGQKVNEGYANLMQAIYSSLARAQGVLPSQIRDGYVDANGVAHKGYRPRFLRRGGQASADLGQKLDIGTPEFTTWFAGSAITDASGAPRVMYHATLADVDFEAFRRAKRDIGIHFGTAGQAEDRLAFKSRLLGSQGLGKPYAPGARIIPVYLSIKNPLRLPDLGLWDADNVRDALLSKLPQHAEEIRKLRTLSEMRAFLQSLGYDGIVYRNTGEVAGGDAVRENLEIARRALHAAQKARRKSISSYDLEDQQTPEYLEFKRRLDISNEFHNANAEDSYIAFEPNQVKSVFNSGTWSPTEARMLMQAVSGPVDTSALPKEALAGYDQEAWDVVREVFVSLSADANIFSQPFTAARSIEKAFEDVVKARFPELRIERISSTEDVPDLDFTEDAADSDFVKGIPAEDFTPDRSLAIYPSRGRQSFLETAEQAKERAEAEDRKAGRESPANYDYARRTDIPIAYIHEKNDGTVWIDVHPLQSGTGGGAAIYSMVGQYAKNSNKVFIGDPHGFVMREAGDPLGEVRRVEHLISLAMRSGSTNHLGLGWRHKLAPFWREGDFAHNFDLLLKASAANYQKLFDLLPELEKIDYNVATDTFTDGDGNAIDLAGFQRRADELSAGLLHARAKALGRRDASGIAAPERIGVATLKRAIALRSLLRQASESVSKRDRLLADAYAKLDAPSTAHGGLRGAFYQGAQKGAASRATFTSGGIKDLLDTDQWAILTAENPKGSKPTPEENARRNEALRQELISRGYDFITGVIGKYKQSESPFVVLGIPAEEAVALAARHGQEAVLTRHGLVYQDGTVDPAVGLTVHKTPPEDFYTMLPDGTTFTVDLDFRKPTERPLLAGMLQAEPEREKAPTTQELRPAVVFGTDLAGDGRQFTAFFSAATKGERKPVRPYTPLLDVNEPEFSEEYDKHLGEFDAHIAASIPGFPEVQRAVGGALLRAYSDGAEVLDIGASEGSFVKALSAASKGRIRTVALDPNPDMAATFAKTKVEGSEYALAAFGSKAQEGEFAWDENGTPIYFYKPDRKFDVVHEAMVFQFISNGRNAQFQRVKELMKPDGLALFEEKIFEDSGEYRANERKKDAYKATYFTQEDLAKKKEEVLERSAQKAALTEDQKREQVVVGMNDLMPTSRELEAALTRNFKFVVQYWSSGNFKGYAASDNEDTIYKFLVELQDLNSEFSTVQTPTPVEKQERDVLEELHYVLRKVQTAPVEERAALSERLAKLREERIALADRDFERSSRWLNQAGGSGKPGAVPGPVIGVHFSKTKLTRLDSSFYGRGIKGAERERIGDDPVLRRRVHFYVDTGNGIKPEPGVGAEAHVARLENLYDADADVLKIFRRAGRDYNAAEKMIIDAGFSGYLSRKSFGDLGTVVLLGEQSIPVTHIGGVEEANAIKAEVPAPLIPEAKLAAIRLSQDRTLPGGAQTAAEWKADISRAYPDIAAAIPWDQMPQDKPLYKDEVSRWLWQTSGAGPWYYSQLQRVVEGAAQASMPAVQWAAWLKANAPQRGVKAAELDASGVLDWLTAQGKVKLEKAEVLAFVQANGVKVEDVVLSDTAPNQQRTRYSEWQLPGGKNYKELLLTLPVRRGEGWRATQSADGRWSVTDANGSVVLENVLAATANEAITKAIASRVDGLSDRSFLSPHWDQPNVLAHVRFNERTDVDGKRVLFIEEIQSDWAQKGKREGFGNRPATHPAGWANINDPRSGGAGIPAAPFVTNTEAWTALTFKRMIAYAAENGFDRVAWTTGEQQVARYDLSKQVGGVYYTKNGVGAGTLIAMPVGTTIRDGRVMPVMEHDNVAEGDIARYVGKEVAEKLLKSTPDKDGFYFVEGDGLKVGGEGMKGYYDKIVPNVANDVLKKLGGGKIGDVKIELPSTITEDNKADLIIEQAPNEPFNGKVTLIRKMPDGSKVTIGVMTRQEAYDYIDSGGGMDGQTITQPGFTITPALRDTVLGGLPLFQPQTQDDARGAFNPETLDLAFLAKADLTTFLHETSHFYLTVVTDMARQPGASDVIKDRAQQILAWFDPTLTLDRWHAMSLEEQRPFHEKFAASGEQYLMSGEAPTPELRSMFRQFADFLKRVYNSLREFVRRTPDAALNEEVRIIFDRMVAAEEVIERAKQRRAQEQFFKDAAEAGMTPDQWARHQALSLEDQQEAEETLRTRALRDMKWLRNLRNKTIAKLQAEAKELRAAVRAEVAQEVQERPLYRAIRWLRRGEATTDTGEETVVAGNKLNSAAVKALFPESENVNWKKLGFGKYGMLSADGLPPDIVAEMFGFRSGEHLVRELLNAPDMDIEIEGLTDQRMLEQYGDLSTAEAIERAADEAIHTSVRSRLIATEIAALNTEVGAPSVLIRAAKDFAAALVGKKTYKTLKPWWFAAETARAAKAAQEHLRKGDRKKAAEAKRRELLNHTATKLAYEGLREMEKIIARLRNIANYTDDSSAVKSRDVDVVNAVRAVLADFGIGQKGKSAREYLAVVKQHNPDLGAALEEVVNTLGANAKDYRNLTLDELKDLREEIESVWFLAKRSKQIEIDGKMVARSVVQDELYARLEEIGIPDRVPGEGQGVTPEEKRGLLVEAFKAKLRRVESWAAAKDGAPMGPFRRYIWQPVREAAERYRSEKSRVLKAYRDLLKTVAPGFKRQLIEAPELGYVFGKAEGGIAKVELLHALLHIGNASNKRKLLLGRGWATEKADGTLDTSRWDSFLARMHKSGVLTKADWDFVQGVWDLLESLKPAAQKAHREVFGKYFAEITAEEVITPFGTYRGGYVPAIADPLVARDAETRRIMDAENENMKFAFPTPAKGFTKARVEYNRPLKLDLRSIAQHIDKVLLFSHLTQPVHDVRRVLSSKQVSQALSRVDPAAFDVMLTPWLNRAAKQVVEEKTPGSEGLSRFWSVARSRAGMAAMFANAANSVQQLTGLSLALLKVRPKYLLEAMAHFIVAPRESAGFVATRSEYVRNRLQQEVAAMSDAIDEILIKPSVYQSAKAWTMRHAYFLQTAVDSVVSPVVWIAAYNQAIETAPKRFTGEELERYAIRLADSAVRETQSAQAAEDVAAFEVGSPFYRMFVQFAGYFNMNANLLGTEFVKLTRDLGLRKGVGRGLYVLVFGFLAPAIVGELIMQAFRGGPDDEDKDGEYLDDWMTSVFGYGTLRYGTAMIPVVGQTINYAANLANAKPYDDRISTAPAISMIETAGRTPVTIYQMIVEEKNITPSKAVREVATLLSISVGLPINAVAKPVQYWADVSEGYVVPAGTVDALRGTITGVASPETKY